MPCPRWLTVIALAILTSGCVPSLHPFYTDEDLTYDANLLGVWEAEGGATWAFAKSGDRSYLLTHTEKGATGRMDAHLFKVGKQLFLDTFPEDPDIKSDFAKWHLLGTHLVWKLSLAGDSLRLAALDPDKVKSMVEQKKLSIAHEQVDSRPVFTASTRDLQAFLARYAEGDDVFGEWGEMKRQK